MKRMAVSIVSLLVACADAPEAVLEELGKAELEVGSVPGDVKCITVKVQGSSHVNLALPVTAGATDQKLALGQLPIGPAVVEASAWNAACPAGTGSPTWIADSVLTEIRLAETARIPLRFRRYAGSEGEVSFLEPAVQVAVSVDTTYALLANGTVRAWGLRSIESSSSPEPFFPALSNVVQVTAGDAFMCMLLADGTARCIGDNTQGQLAIGTDQPQTIIMPVSVVGGAPLSGIRQIAAGANHACAVTDDGLYCWGSGTDGKLGQNGVKLTRATLVAALPGRPVQVSASPVNTCALNNAGNVYCFGTNAAGQLGRGIAGGSSSVANLPVLVSAPSTGPSVSLTGITAVRALGDGMCALRADGVVFCWGTNTGGGFGDTSLAAGKLLTVATPIARPEAVVDLDGTSKSTCSVLAGGSVVCAGQGGLGVLGDGRAADSPTLVTARSIERAVQVAASSTHVCALDEDGEIWCWGNNDHGQLGTGDKTARFAPVRVEITN